MRFGITPSEKVYSLDVDFEFLEYIGRRVKDESLFSFGEYSPEIYSEFVEYDIDLTISIDEDGLIKEINYYKCVESGGPKPRTDFKSLNKRDRSRFISIFEEISIPRYQEYYENLINIIKKDDFCKIIKETKNSFLFKLNNKEYLIKKAKICKYIECYLTFLETKDCELFWKANPHLFNIEEMKLIQYLLSKINIQSYEYYKGILSKKLEREELYNTYLDVDKVEKFLEKGKHLIIEKYLNTIKYIDWYYHKKTLYYLARNKKTKILKEILVNLNNSYFSIERDLLDYIVSKQLFDTFKDLISHFPPMLLKDQNYHNREHFLEYLFKNNIILNYSIRHENLIEIAIKSNYKENFIWYGFHIQKMYDTKNFELLKYALNIDKVNMQIHELIRIIIRNNDFTSFTLMIDKHCKELVKTMNSILEEIFIRKDKFSEYLKKYLLENFDRKYLLSIELSEMFLRLDNLEDIKNFIINNNLGTNDFILEKIVDSSYYYKQALNHNESSKYINLALELYNSKFDLFEYGLYSKDVICESIFEYIVCFNLEDKYYKIFDYKKLIGDMTPRTFWRKCVHSGSEFRISEEEVERVFKKYIWLVS